MKYKRYWAIIITLMFIASCGINGDLKKTAKSRKQALENTQSQIDSALNKYTEWKKSSEYDRFERYDKTYSWAKQFDEALLEVESARTVWTEIEQILDNNNPKEEGKLNQKIRQINSRFVLALKKSREPNRQIGVLRQLMEDAPKYINAADKQVSEMKTIISDIRPIVDKAVADSKSFGWNKEKDISNRFGQLEGIYNTAADMLNGAKAQHNSDDPDYAVIATNLDIVQKKFPELKQADTHLRKLLGELNRSYTKRLIDMKYVYAVTPGRTSWANYYEYPSETDYEYRPQQVDEATFKYFSQKTGDIANGLQRVRLYIEESMWYKLNINVIERLPRGDDSAVFWISSTDIEYYHRYLVIENGTEKESGWEEVDEDDFAANINNLGMDIVSKPYGLYASEVIEDAAPPGMAYVGNKKYGNWEKDSSGGSFWAFYGRYAFLNAMLGGHRYYYNDWNHWNRNYRGRAPYYGKNADGSTIYGTSGSTVRSNSQYRSSTFSRQGGIKSAPANVRSAAGSVRGRGPGSRGK
ncbi:MAG: hypothetical protein KKC46_11220 [Proteobacteria bacterium]|nr:hypothetical protein [Pseudomonadota bacterium]